MHSSRMRTARLLPVRISQHALLRGVGRVSAPGGGGLSAPGGGVIAPGSVCSRGVSAPGVSGQIPPDRILDTRFLKYYLAPTSLRVVIRQLTTHRPRHTYLQDHTFFWLPKIRNFHRKSESFRRVF